MRDVDRQAATGAMTVEPGPSGDTAGRAIGMRQATGRSSEGPEKTAVLFIQSQTFFGADSLVHSLIMRELDRESFEVHVACAPPPSAAWEQLAGIPGLHLLPLNFGPSVYGRSAKERIAAVRRGLPVLAHVPRLVAYARRHRIGIVHATEKPRDALAAIAVARGARARSVVHLHVKCHEHLTGRALWALHRADAIVGVSEFVARSVRERGFAAERVHAILNAIDLEEWSDGDTDPATTRAGLGLSDEDTVLVIAARLFAWKGHRELLNALAMLPSRDRPVKLLVVGQDDPRAHPGGGLFSRELRALASALGIERQVVFTGHRKDMRAIVAASDIVALPSFEEPFGLAVVEGMAQGKPVVALASGGTPEVVANGLTGLLSAPGDISRLAANIDRLASNPELRRQMGAAGRARAEQLFAPERLARDFERLYAGLAGREAMVVPPAPGR